MVHLLHFLKVDILELVVCMGGDVCTVDIHSVVNSSLDPQCVSMSRKQIKTFYQVEWLPSKHENHVERWCTLEKKTNEQTTTNKQTTKLAMQKKIKGKTLSRN